MLGEFTEINPVTPMANNLHVFYDLSDPERTYDAVIEKLKTLGACAEIHESYWHVNSSLSARQAAAALWEVMEASDTVYVVDATNNIAAWQNIPDEVAMHIRDQWPK